jgi:acyl-CoA synthetase (AMP-forming)/AMP-acid ligase II
MSHAILIIKSWRWGGKESLVTWLPPYHDMGLIGCILTPASCGMRTIILSPLAFIANPLIWLETITKYKSECSGIFNNI